MGLTFGGRGGGTPGLRVDLRREMSVTLDYSQPQLRTATTSVALKKLEEIIEKHLQLHVFEGVLQVGDVSPGEGRGETGEGRVRTREPRKARTCQTETNEGDWMFTRYIFPREEEGRVDVVGEKEIWTAMGF